MVASAGAAVLTGLAAREDCPSAEFCKATKARAQGRAAYPPDKQEKATRTVLEQAEVLSDSWAA